MNKPPPTHRPVYLAPWRVGGDVCTGLFRAGEKTPEVYSSNTPLLILIAEAVNRDTAKSAMSSVAPDFSNQFLEEALTSRFPRE